MDVDKIIQGKHILIVDDEQDVLDSLVDLLEICKVDTALSFEKAKALMEENYYDIVVLDIMGVRGYDLLKIANEHKIPAIMLTGHALSSENLKRSADEGAAYYAPKDEIHKIGIFVADVIEAIEQKKSPWLKVFERLGSFYDKRFNGPDWREKEKKYWEKKIKHFGI
jgi:DNA-binding NtrC family response regulator